MRVSTRIVSGFGILMAVSFAALTYQVVVIDQMQSINRDLSSVNFRAASIVLKMLEYTRDLQEDSRKYFATAGDPVYESDLHDVHADFTNDLVSLRATIQTEKERAQVEQLTRALDQFWRTIDTQKAHAQSGETNELPPAVADVLGTLQAQTETLYSALQLSIRDQVSRAAQVGDRAERVSWIAGAFALLIVVVVAVVIVQAITDPLRRLTQGTRTLAKGQFWHRLPTDSGDEFAELARDFNVMTERLGELDQMKKDFVSHVSHDLKAPLASMRQVFHLLLQRIPGPLNPQQERLLHLSNKSAERLASMVGNLLDVSRMEAGTMEYELAPHDLVSLARAVADEFDVQAQERSIRLRVAAAHPEIFVECDSDRITQVVGNLVENALKFAPDDSEIIVNVYRNERGSAVVSVLDSGPGVADDHKKRIFEKFHQVKQGKKISGQGVGLGLAICKTIVEAHRGEIWVEDNPTGGSVFFVILPHSWLGETSAVGETNERTA